MEIEEAKKLAMETEIKILELIRDFTNKTGFSVADVIFNYATTTGVRYMHSPISVELLVHI